MDRTLDEQLTINHAWSLVSPGFSFVNREYLRKYSTGHQELGRSEELQGSSEVLCFFQIQVSTRSLLLSSNKLCKLESSFETH